MSKNLFGSAIQVFDSPDAASQYVASIVAETIDSRKEMLQPLVVGLATGSTMKNIYSHLVKKKEEGLSFSNVKSFNLDEYYPIERDNPQSFYDYMHRYLFNKIDINRQNIHLLSGAAPAGEVDCLAYEKAITDNGGIDIQLLGIGRNGHIAFNEPGSPFDSLTRFIQLDSQTREDAIAEFGGLANVPRKAITMGIKTIMKARRIILVAFGKQKSPALFKAFFGPLTKEVPASILQLHPNITIVVDEDCAEGLNQQRAEGIHLLKL